MGGGGGQTSVQDVPGWARPFYESVYSSAFGSGRTSAGQPGYDPTYRGNPQPWGGYQAPYPTAPQAGYPQGAPQGQGTPQQPFTGGMQQAQGQQAGMQGQPPIQQPQGQPGTGQQGYFPGAPAGSMQAAGAAAGPSIIGPSFQGPFTAPPSQLEAQALQQKAQFGQNLMGFEQPLMGLGMAQAQGQFLNSNPYLQNAIDIATRPVYQAYEQNAPMARSQAISSGAYKGSSRRDLLEGGLQRDLQQNIGDISGQLAFQNYAQERQFQQNAGALLDQASRLGQLPPELMLQAGAGQRGLAQMGIEERLRQFEESINAPFRPIMNIAQIIRGQPTGMQSTQQAPAGGLGGGIIGALGGAAAGSAIGNAAGYGGGGGAALGGLLGGLAGGLT